MVIYSIWAINTRTPVMPIGLRDALIVERDEYLLTNMPKDVVTAKAVLKQIDAAIDAACTIAAGLQTHDGALVLVSCTGYATDRPQHHLYGRMSVSVDQVAAPGR
jgi:hypothetical protein